MKAITHRLKIRTLHYQAVEKGIKRFELRKNDRHFNIGDHVYLDEYVGEIPTGRCLGPLEITYIFRGGEYGLAEDYCIFCWKEDRNE